MRTKLVRFPHVAHHAAQVRGGRNRRDDARVEDPPSGRPRLNVGLASMESSCVLILCGELNWSSIPALEAHIDQIGRAACRHVVVDVIGLVAIDSVGLQVLIGLDADVRGLGAHLGVAGARGQVAEALATTSLDLIDTVWTPVPGGHPLVQPTVLLDEGIPL